MKTTDTQGWWAIVYSGSGPYRMPPSGPWRGLGRAQHATRQAAREADISAPPPGDALTNNPPRMAGVPWVGGGVALRPINASLA